MGRISNWGSVEIMLLLLLTGCATLRKLPVVSGTLSPYTK